MKKILTFLVCVLLSGCSVQPPRIAQTESGWPEVVLSGAIKERAVHDTILLNLVSAGYQVEADNGSYLKFSRQMNRAEEAGRRAVNGGDPGTFRDEVVVTIVRTSAGIRVLVQPAWSKGVRGQKIQELNSTFFE